MELESEAGGTMSTGNVKKNIPIKLKSQPKATRGRPKKGARAKKEATPPEVPEQGTYIVINVDEHETWLT